MSNKDKILITYTKFKMIYYCNAGYHAKATELLYPLNNYKFKKLISKVLGI